MTDLDPNAPPDRYNLVYITFLIHGLGTLIGWCMFINAIGYFLEYKFAVNYIGYVFPHNKHFMQYLTLCSNIPAITFTWCNLFIQIGGDLTIRIVWSITLQIIIFIVTIILAMTDTSEIPYAFFYITMVSVVLLHSSNGIYQSTVFGVAAMLPGKYTGALILGNNISGAFTAIISILAKMGTPNLKMAAIYYFITALFILLICFDTYFALPLNKFYRYYELKEKKEKQVAKAETGKNTPPYLLVFKQTLPQLANVFMIFLVTLLVYPAIQAGIRKSDPNFFIPGEYYTDVMCFLNFSIFALIGSWLPSYFIWPGPDKLWIPSVLRFAYIPLFVFCNYQVPDVERVFPVLINNDYLYFIIAATMALTSGYFSSVIMMHVPAMVEESNVMTAGMMASTALMSGISLGIWLSFIWPSFIGHVGA